MVTPDLRGYGESALTPQPYTDAGDLVEMLDALEIERADVVGASDGGRVALQLASATPERVARLLLLAPGAVTDDVASTPAVRWFGEQENALLEAADVDGATELNVRTWLGPDADDDARGVVRAAQLRAFQVQLAAGDDVSQGTVDVDLAALTAPTTIVTGGHDLDYFQAVARHLVVALPHARLVELPRAGHLPSLERPDEVTAPICTTLSSPRT